MSARLGRGIWYLAQEFEPYMSDQCYKKILKYLEDNDLRSALRLLLQATTNNQHCIKVYSEHGIVFYEVILDRHKEDSDETK